MKAWRSIVPEYRDSRRFDGCGVLRAAYRALYYGVTGRATTCPKERPGERR